MIVIEWYWRIPTEKSRSNEKRWNEIQCKCIAKYTYVRRRTLSCKFAKCKWGERSKQASREANCICTNYWFILRMYGRSIVYRLIALIPVFDQWSQLIAPKWIVFISNMGDIDSFLTHEHFFKNIFKLRMTSKHKLPVKQRFVKFTWKTYFLFLSSDIWKKIKFHLFFSPEIHQYFSLILHTKNS